MSLKFVGLLAFVTAASAVILPMQQVYHQAPVTTTLITPAAAVARYAHAQPIFAKHDDQYDSHPQYKFTYDINDEHTGDNHSQQEERDGDLVHGEYSLIDADGFRRVVQYTVDPHSGFNAVVNRIPLGHHDKTVVKSVPAPEHYDAHGPATTVVKQYPVPMAYQQHH